MDKSQSKLYCAFKIIFFSSILSQEISSPIIIILPSKYKQLSNKINCDPDFTKFQFLQ